MKTKKTAVVEFDKLSSLTMIATKGGVGPCPYYSIGSICPYLGTSVGRYCDSNCKRLPETP